MNKLIKSSIVGLAALGLFGVVATSATVDAAVVVFNADNGTDGATQAKNTNFIDDANLTLQSKGATSTYGTDYALGDYTLGLKFANNATTTKGFYFTNTSADSLELTVYFGAYNESKTYAVESYFTCDTENKVTTSTTAPVSLTVNLEAGVSTYLVTTGRQTALYEVSYNTGATYYNVTITDSGSQINKNIKENTYLSEPDTMFAYPFVAYYTDSNYENLFDYKNTPVTGDLELYVKRTSLGYFDDDYHLTTACISPFANEIGSSTALESDYKISPIFAALTGCKGYTSGNGAIVTNGGANTSQKSLEINLTAKTSGYLIVNMSCGGNSARNAKVLNSSGTEIDAIIGDNVWVTDSDYYVARTLVYQITSADKYYIGGTNSMRIFDVQFVETLADLVTFSGATVKGTSTSDTTLGAVRFLGKLENVTIDDITSIKVTAQIKGYSEHKFDVTSVYTAINGFEAATAADNTLYFYFSVYDLDSTFNNDEFNFIAEITYSDNSVYTSTTYSITYTA